MPILFLLIGSFLNVVIHRLPRGESIALPPSHCPGCGMQLRPRDLVPVLSYLFLKGQCRGCKQVIHWRYPVVETVTALILSLVWYYGPPEHRVAFVGFAAILVAMSFIDLEHYYLPDALQWTAVVWWVLSALLSPPPLWPSHLYGAVGGFITLYLIYFISRKGMGFGDVKLAGAMGLYLGFRNIWLALFLGFLLGAVVGICLILSKKKGRKDMLPFGPFLAMGFLVTAIWGEALLAWYAAIYW